MKKNSGSFRDPSGYVFEEEGQIFRTVTDYASDKYDKVKKSSFFRDSIANHKLIATREVDKHSLLKETCVSYVLEHPRVFPISYPYEWSFSMLKSAALHHLEMQIEALEQNIVFSDASAYNIQFENGAPIFIDILSLRPYVEGEYWSAHRQFCEHFLNPLLLYSLFGISHNAWYRGNQEGIPTSALKALLPAHKKLSLGILSHVVLLSNAQNKANTINLNRLSDLKSKKLSKSAYNGLLNQLHSWINRLEYIKETKTIWGNYVDTKSYSLEDNASKIGLIKKYIEDVSPVNVLDVGCNTGEFSQIALDAGAKKVIGFEFDQSALEQAWQRASCQKIDFIPLYMDVLNQSPSQGWAQKERLGVNERFRVDIVLGLAIIHHMVISGNIPLDEVIKWFTSLAPKGVIEFIPKSDPMIEKMLALREDVFFDYTQDSFERSLSNYSTIRNQTRISTANRVLYFFG